MPAVFRWASGATTGSGIVAESFGGHEGDLVRAMRRLIDLLRQLAEGPTCRSRPRACSARPHAWWTAASSSRAR